MSKYVWLVSICYNLVIVVCLLKTNINGDAGTVIYQWRFVNIWIAWMNLSWWANCVSVTQVEYYRWLMWIYAHINTNESAISLTSSRSYHQAIYNYVHWSYVILHFASLAFISLLFLLPIILKGSRTIISQTNFEMWVTLN